MPRGALALCPLPPCRHAAPLPHLRWPLCCCHRRPLCCGGALASLLLPPLASPLCCGGAQAGGAQPREAEPCEGEPCEGAPCEGEPCEGEPCEAFLPAPGRQAPIGSSSESPSSSIGIAFSTHQSLSAPYVSGSAMKWPHVSPYVSLLKATVMGGESAGARRGGRACERSRARGRVCGRPAKWCRPRLASTEFHCEIWSANSFHSEFTCDSLMKCEM